jgi:hypothetical protein
MLGKVIMLATHPFICFQPRNQQLGYSSSDTARVWMIDHFYRRQQHDVPWREICICAARCAPAVSASVARHCRPWRRFKVAPPNDAGRPKLFCLLHSVAMIIISCHGSCRRGCVGCAPTARRAQRGSRARASATEAPERALPTRDMSSSKRRQSARCSRPRSPTPPSRMHSPRTPRRSPLRAVAVSPPASPIKKAMASVRDGGQHQAACRHARCLAAYHRVPSGHHQFVARKYLPMSC